MNNVPSIFSDTKKQLFINSINNEDKFYNERATNSGMSSPIRDSSVFPFTSSMSIVIVPTGAQLTASIAESTPLKHINLTTCPKGLITILTEQMKIYPMFLTWRRELYLNQRHKKSKLGKIN